MCASDGAADDAYDRMLVCDIELRRSRPPGLSSEVVSPAAMWSSRSDVGDRGWASASESVEWPVSSTRPRARLGVRVRREEG